jgi:hypothetical protein
MIELVCTNRKKKMCFDKSYKWVFGNASPKKLNFVLLKINFFMCFGSFWCIDLKNNF